MDNQTAIESGPVLKKILPEVIDITTIRNLKQNARSLNVSVEELANAVYEVGDCTESVLRYLNSKIEYTHRIRSDQYYSQTRTNEP